MFAQPSGLRCNATNNCIARLLISTVLIFSLTACKGQAAPTGSPVASSAHSSVVAAQNSYADVVSHVAPAVVTLYATKVRWATPVAFAPASSVGRTTGWNSTLELPLPGIAAERK